MKSVYAFHLAACGISSSADGNPCSKPSMSVWRMTSDCTHWKVCITDFALLPQCIPEFCN